MKIIANEFVKRQTPESRFSHFEGEWNDLVHAVRWHWESRTAGYREGVICIAVPPIGFYSGVVCLKSGDKLLGGFEPRQDGETPRKFVTATGSEKIPAESVEVILYSSKLLDEGGDNDLPPEDGNWEIISINASPTEGKMPIDPMVLMHNHFGSDGGTDTHMSDPELVRALRESFTFWKDKAMFGGV
jgi:hypothetical protein